MSSAPEAGAYDKQTTLQAHHGRMVPQILRRHRCLPNLTGCTGYEAARRARVQKPVGLGFREVKTFLKHALRARVRSTASGSEAVTMLRTSSRLVSRVLRQNAAAPVSSFHSSSRFEGAQTALHHAHARFASPHCIFCSLKVSIPLADTQYDRTMENASYAAPKDIAGGERLQHHSHCGG